MTKILEAWIYNRDTNPNAKKSATYIYCDWIHNSWEAEPASISITKEWIKKMLCIYIMEFIQP